MIKYNRIILQECLKYNDKKLLRLLIKILIKNDITNKLLNITQDNNKNVYSGILCLLQQALSRMRPA